MSDHPDLEALTAYADDEVDAAERDAVDAHLATCAVCARTVELERATSGLVRGLTAVEPPAGFLDRVSARGPAPRSQLRHNTRFAVANVAAAAAVWVGVVGVARLTGGERVRPEFSDLVGTHEASALVSDRLSLRSSGDAPTTLGDGYRLVDVGVSGGRREAHYTDGTEWLSMYVEPGRLDTDALPGDARPIGAGTWALRLDGDEVAVAERDGVVIVVVGPDSADVIATAGANAPAPSIRQRVDAAARGLLDCFGLG